MDPSCSYSCNVGNTSTLPCSGTVPKQCLLNLKQVRTSRCQCRRPPNLERSAALHSRKASLHRQQQGHSSTSRTALQAVIVAAGEVVEVESLKGVRLRQLDNGRPQVQYLVKWKDGSPDTWEPAQNLADNLLRDFEENWWSICKKGDEEAMRELLANGGQLLARTVNAERRSGLHFAAAIGNAKCTQMLCEAGAEVDMGDKEGYTALHMAAGYSHVSTVQALLAAGADPEVQDNEGRNIIDLVESVRERMPLVPETMSRRMALEDVAACLTDNLFEDVEPVQILDSRLAENGTREFLVQWSDGMEDSWVAEKFVAEDVIEDFDAGLEYANAECILDCRQKGDQRTYLVRWQDGHEDSWEPEENVSPDIVRLWEAEQEKAAAEQAQQLQRAAQHAEHTSDGNGSRAPQILSRKPAERPTAVAAT